MLKKLKEKVTQTVKKATSNSLWDQSAEQYIKNDFKWHLASPELN